MPAIPNSQLGLFPVGCSGREIPSPFIWGQDAPAGPLVECESLCEQGLAVLPSVLQIQPLTEPSAASGDGCKWIKPGALLGPCPVLHGRVIGRAGSCSAGSWLRASSALCRARCRWTPCSASLMCAARAKEAVSPSASTHGLTSESKTML